MWRRFSVQAPAELGAGACHRRRRFLPDANQRPARRGKSEPAITVTYQRTRQSHSQVPNAQMLIEASFATSSELQLHPSSIQGRERRQGTPLWIDEQPNFSPAASLRTGGRSPIAMAGPFAWGVARSEAMELCLGCRSRVCTPSELLSESFLQEQTRSALRG